MAVVAVVWRSLQREADAAAAARLGLRVPDLELGSDQLVDEVDFGTGQQGKRDRVHHRRGAVAFDAHVVRVRRLDEVEAVLEATAAAAVHGDAQQHRPPFRLGQGVEAAGGGGGQDEVGHDRFRLFALGLIWAAPAHP